MRDALIDLDKQGVDEILLDIRGNTGALPVCPEHRGHADVPD